MATVEMQEAARKVLLENKRLRALLAEKGVPKADVEAFLRGYDYDASLPTPELTDEVDAQSQAAPSVDLQQPTEMPTSAATNRSVSAVSPPSTPVDIGLESASQTGSNSQCTGCPHDTELFQPGDQSEKDLGRESLLPNLLGPVSDCYCPVVEPVPDQAQASETECGVAANILAGFRGHGDVQRARAELGCPDNVVCSITNAALLKTLDSEHASNKQPCNPKAIVTH